MNMFNKIVGLGLSILFVWNLNAQTVHELELEKAQQLAIEYNQRIKEQNIEISKAKSRIKQQISTGLPQISGNVDLQYFPQIATSLVPAEFFGGNSGEFAEVKFGSPHSLMAGVTLDQLLFDGSFFVGLQAARLYEDFVRKQKELTESEVKYMIEQSYFNVLAAKENVTIINDGIDLTESLKNETQALYRAGFVEKLDVDRLKFLISQQVAEKQNAINQLELAKQVLQFQIGIPLTDSIVVQEALDDVINDTFSANMDNNFFNNRKEYQLIDQSIGLQELNIKNLKSGYYPKLNAFASHSQSAQRNKFNYFNGDEPWFPTTVLGLNLSVPLFDGGWKRHIIAQEKMNIDILKLQQENLREGILLEAEQGKTNWKNAVEQYQLAKDNLTLANNIYNITHIKYKEGIGSSLELNTAEQDKIAARGRYIQSVVQMLVAKTNLKKAYGYY